MSNNARALLVVLVIAVLVPIVAITQNELSIFQKVRITSTDPDALTVGGQPIAPGGGIGNGANTFTATQTIAIPSLTGDAGGTAPVTARTGIALVNPTSAVATDQLSPALAFCSSTSGTATPLCYQFVIEDGALQVQEFTNGSPTPHHNIAAFGAQEKFTSFSLNAGSGGFNGPGINLGNEFELDAIPGGVTWSGIGAGTSVRLLQNSTNTFKLRAGDGTDAATFDAKTYSTGGTVGVSCAAGTLNPTTAVITNGIVTHC